MLGRFIYGLGFEGIMIAKHVLILKWFEIDEVSLPFGIALACARFGSIITDNLSPRIANVCKRAYLLSSYLLTYILILGIFNQCGILDRKSTVDYKLYWDYHYNSVRSLL